ncbi:MAG: hypothetical protein F4060_14220 [Holophagales bacterium]|nr:hypothetical protein [Holophagales bacterium]MYG30172.1 hypothetical protein [Holophagales bacterium]MYI81086.1 hypothetical protein [Holophagales bacterium]
MKKSLLWMGAAILGLVLLAIGYGAGWLVHATGVGRTVPLEELSERERAFAERMQNVDLVGHFTIEGIEGLEDVEGVSRDKNPERYEIASVSKLEGEGDRWRFDVRVVYMTVDVTLPVVVPIVWAGDTPMVSITDFELPGLGDQFGARVLFYDERYAGTWDHGPYGGLMYGMIEPAGTE